MADSSVEEKEIGSEGQESPAPKKPQDGPTRKHKILVVDDEEKFLKVVLKILPAVGCQVEICKDPETALDKLQSDNPFSLLITDNRMPAMRGTELMQKAKKISPNTIRMLATAYSDNQLVEDAVNKGETHRFIKKPVDFKLMIKLVQECLRKYEDDESTRGQLSEINKLHGQIKNFKSEKEQLQQKVQGLKKSLKGIVSGITLLALIGAGSYGYVLFSKKQAISASSIKMGSWVLYKNRTALDTSSNLMWMTVDFRNLENRMPRDWNEAMAWADKMNKQAFAGFSDWRVPTIEEYRGTYDPEHTRIAYDKREDYRVGYPKAFQDGGGYGYWSSDSNAPENALYFFFIGGYDKTVNRNFQNPTMSVRLVRTP